MAHTLKWRSNGGVRVLPLGIGYGSIQVGVCNGVPSVALFTDSDSEVPSVILSFFSFETVEVFKEELDKVSDLLKEGN